MPFFPFHSHNNKHLSISFLPFLIHFYRCRLQTQNCAVTKTTTAFAGPFDAIRQINYEHGIAGVYRGWWCTCFREVPSFGLYFACYDVFREKLVEKKLPNWGCSMIAGGLSGCFTWALVYPVDVIKTRIQTADLNMRSKDRRVFRLGRQLVRENGWKYLYRGLGVTMVRAFPVNAIIFPVYEMVNYVS
jgi:hypothetical protein